MKKLVICCDGTWNRLDAPFTTNVVKFAESVATTDKDQIPQIVFYDEGVGTGGAIARNIEKLWGGAFGEGLLRNVEDAYRFLIFNYEPGDEIFVIGFSRGAYTARSLVGLVRNCGILSRRDADKVTKAMALYRSRGESSEPDSDRACEFRLSWSPTIYLSDFELNWRKKNVLNFDQESCIQLKFQYVGIWDTVGALGIPSHWAASGLFNSKFRFHDHNLSSSVLSARHAVAIDERRKVFAPTLWENLNALNDAFGLDQNGIARYLQVWFPGDHGSVGGGGNVTGLSDVALEWVVDGARRAGISFSKHNGAAINNLNKDYKASLKNSVDKSGINVLGLATKKDRDGPQQSDYVSESAWKRYCEPGENLYENEAYRPKSLNHVKDTLETICLRE